MFTFSGERDRPIVLAGGTGQVGALLQRHFRAQGVPVVVLTRSTDAQPAVGDGVEIAVWDGRSAGGEWHKHIDGAGAVINLAGRSVDCRYSSANLDAMMQSRVDSTRAVGRAIAAAQTPPPVWLQMSTATIYAHRFDAPNDERDGQIGGDEPDVPDYWRKSIEIAQAWEAELQAADTPSTRRIALRTAMVMTPDRGGIFDVLARLTRWGLGGAMAGGRQWISWIHGVDFCRALDFLLENDLEGPVNLAAPEPIPQADFQRCLRKALGVRIGLPATQWMLEVGAFFLRTDTELMLKSRRVVPGRLLEAGFGFEHPEWMAAAEDLVGGLRVRGVGS